MTSDDRVEALEDLVMLRVPPAEAQQRLRTFPWDSDEQLITLSRADLHRVLDEYLLETLSVEAVELWANAVEGRDDIGLETGFETVIKDTVFQLATPEITTPLTKSVALELKRRLDQK